MPTNRNLDAASLISISCIFVGWFFIDTLTVTLGALRHGVVFLDLPAVIADPTRMFFAIDRTFRGYLFGAVCVLSLLLPFAIYLRAQRWTWLLCFAPLAFMLISTTMLYSRMSGQFLATTSDPASVNGTLIRLANGLAQRGGGVVARHVTIGVGGYAAFLGSVLLAVGGLRGYRSEKHDAP